ncbi:MAG: serine/threonine protein kinase [Myxococcales bacterium]|nr:serine/threonine protein kinase [Myxococcales bacterium]MCB9713171.1 serine/threonine protein kinase [Myxococcales bacterium]
MVDDDRRPQRIAMGPLRPGDRVGRYIVRSKLGRGGMGVVYGAYDPLLGRRVALKLVRHRDTPENVEAHVDERLRREAQALARLAHPNVVSLYDVGTCDRGDYLALELVPGIDLDEWLRKGTHSWKEIVEVFLAAGRGLAAAHTAGLIHRDFKPANVIVGPHGHVTVVDFGLARSTELDTTVSNGPEGAQPQIHSDALLNTRLTGTNIIVGTRGYMAPEQLLGLSVGPRADQFSFCVALFEALYGRRPYPGKNAVETATSFANGIFEEPEDRRGVSGRLHEALRRGLSVEPDDRFPSMDALLAALRRGLPASRRRWLLAAALAATASISAGAGAWGHALLSDSAEPACDHAGSHAHETDPRR